MTVKRHREFMILWSIIWISLITFRFGFSLYFVSLIYELTKIILLGNMFLAESFVVYPLLYLLGALFSNKQALQSPEAIFLLGIIWFLALSLSPLWPLLFVVTIYLFIKNESKSKFILSFTLLGILCFLFLYPKVDFRDYYQDVFWINAKYYIPHTTDISAVNALFSAFFSPLLTLASKGESLLLPLLKLLSLIYLYDLFILIRRKEYSKALALHLILFLSNLRFINPGNTLYGVFHMLPWYATLLFGTISFFRIPRIPYFLILVLVMLFSLPVAREMLWDRRDLDTDYFVHYSPSADLSKVVQTLSLRTPRTIWVEPVNYWVHYQNNSKLYTTMINYYRWMDNTPPFKTEFTQRLEQGLPDIVYINNQNLGLGDLISRYTQLTRDGGKTMLYIRSDILSTLSEFERKELAFYRFMF